MSDAEKVIGVLGGMGPEVTLAFYANLIAATPAGKDQDHLQVIIHSNPTIPDRTAAALGLGPSPVPAMLAGIESLARAGAAFVVIPCVSAHIFIEELRRDSPLPIISILDVVADAIAAHPSGIRRVGLLATEGTVRAGVFAQRLSESGVEVVTPWGDDQAAVSGAIHAVKAGADPTRRVILGATLQAVTHRLMAASAQGVILGCTEISLVFSAGTAGIPVFDSLKVLAAAAVRAAGRAPVVVESPKQGGK